jgi:hypothetical protein
VGVEPSPVAMMRNPGALLECSWEVDRTLVAKMRLVRWQGVDSQVLGARAESQE